MNKLKYVTVNPNPNNFVLVMLDLFAKPGIVGNHFIYKKDLLKKINNYQNEFKIKYFQVSKKLFSITSEDLNNTLEMLKALGGLELACVKNKEAVIINNCTKLFAESDAYKLPKEEKEYLLKKL